MNFDNYRRAIALPCLLLALPAAACLPESDESYLDEEEDAEEVGEASDEIIGGTATTARPEIGMLFRRNTMCTATLIAPQYAITAAHCLNTSNYQDTVVDPDDRFVIRTPSGTQLEWSIAAYYSFGSHFTEKIWNGLSSDLAIMKLNGIASGNGTPVEIADHRVKSASTWSTRFGFGCTNRETQAGAGTKRYRSFQGTTSNILCYGDSGGPTLWGSGVNASPLWAIHSGFATDITGTFDLVSDAAYHKKQIEGVMHAFDGEYEYGIDRYGGDYEYIATSTPAACRNECANDSRCRAWTHVGGTCFLKESVPNWAPLTGAWSGLSPNRPSSPEVGYDRPGSDYTSFLFTGSDSACIDACSKDYRCQAYAIAPSGSQKRCWLKDETPAPVANANVKSAPKRGLTFNMKRNGTVFHTFTYSMPSPEICQSECAKYSQCQSWTYRGPSNGVSPQCWLNSNVGTAASASKYVSGLKSQMYR